MSSTRFELKRLAVLATPVVITQVTSMLMGVVDILMVGHVSVNALGAASLGRLWVFGTSLFGMGVVFGLDPLVTQAHGAGDTRRLAVATQRGAVLALALGLPLGILWLFTDRVLLLLGQSHDLAALAQSYVTVQIPSIPAILLFAVIRQHLQGRAIMRPAMWTAIFANGVNVLLNWVLIFGHWGAPAMGLTGAGIATAITRWFMFGTLLFITLRFRLHEGGWVPWSREAIRFSGLREILHYGLPVGLQISFEVWAFEITTLMSGRLGAVPLAAHTIALNLASLSFMVPLGISGAAVTRVGNLIGEGRPRDAQRASWVALAMGAGVMTVSAVAFVVLRGLIPRIYTADAAVVAAAAGILPIAGAFQIFDGTQVVGTGVLRGMGRTRPAATIYLVGYYVLALPMAWWLGFRLGLGLPGVWWGLCLGLASVAIMLVAWIWRRGPAKLPDASVLASEAPAP